LENQTSGKNSKKPAVTDKQDDRFVETVTQKKTTMQGMINLSLSSTWQEKSNLIGWRQTLTTPPNHIHFLLVRAKKSPTGKRA
jgi:hypothetical protein